MKLAVIGGGIAGCVSALFLAQAGHDVVLFEKEKLGSGASGLALGALVPFGPHVKGRPAAIQRESLARWPELAAKLSELSGIAVSDFYRGHALGHQVRIPKVFEVFRVALQRAGVLVREGVHVPDLLPLRGAFDGVVVAAGWGSKALAGMPMSVISGVAIRLWPVAPVDVPLTYTGEIYAVSDWDGSVLVGSVSTPMGSPGDGFVDETDVRWLFDRAVAEIPALAGADVVGKWVGYRPDSRPKVPLVREMEPRVWAVSGLGKIGFGLAFAVGEAVLAVVAGEK